MSHPALLVIQVYEVRDRASGSDFWYVKVLNSLSPAGKKEGWIKAKFLAPFQGQSLVFSSWSSPSGLLLVFSFLSSSSCLLLLVFSARTLHYTILRSVHLRGYNFGDVLICRVCIICCCGVHCLLLINLFIQQ